MKYGNAKNAERRRKSKMKILFMTIILALLVGCSSQTESPQEKIARGKLRHSLFVECMELASKNTRKADDDVSDIISECSTQSLCMANGMSK